ncbi:MAG: hypothetical protein DME94_07730, partial [Verrucomicrobia bacterium]
FVVIPRGQRIGRPKQLKLPVLVKPVKEEASYGISQASFVQNEEQFRERVAFIHEKYNSDAIAEEYIEGRELYVSIMGNVRLTVFPIRELVFREAGAWRTTSPKISIRCSSRKFKKCARTSIACLRSTAMRVSICG